MIAKLQGTVDTIFKDGCILMVAGVGYRLFCSRFTLSRLTLGTPATLMVETLIRQDAWLLFAFSSEEEQEWFRLLTTIPGVGPKVALALQSTLSPDEMMLAIASGDKAMVSRADGVGPKLATRILSELKDKVNSLGLSLGGESLGSGGKNASIPKVATSGVMQDAVSALTYLGYPQSTAFEAVGKILQSQGELPLEQLIQMTLQQLGQKGGPS